MILMGPLAGGAIPSPWLDWYFAGAVLAAVIFAGLHFVRMFATLQVDGAGVDELDVELVGLREKKVRLLEDLRDIELDFRMNKISEADYLRRKQKLEPETIAVLKALELREGIPEDDEDDEDDRESDVA